MNALLNNCTSFHEDAKDIAPSHIQIQPDTLSLQMLAVYFQNLVMFYFLRRVLFDNT